MFHSLYISLINFQIPFFFFSKLIEIFIGPRSGEYLQGSWNLMCIVRNCKLKFCIPTFWASRHFALSMFDRVIYLLYLSVYSKKRLFSNFRLQIKDYKWIKKCISIFINCASRNESP